MRLDASAYLKRFCGRIGPKSSPQIPLLRIYTLGYFSLFLLEPTNPDSRPRHTLPSPVPEVQ